MNEAADSAKRSARTGIQGGISAQLLIQGWNLFAPEPYRLNFEQAAWLTVAGSAVPAIVAYLMNLIEQVSGHSFLKGASSTSLGLLHDKIDAIAAEVGRMGNELEQRGLVTPTPHLILDDPEIHR